MPCARAPAGTTYMAVSARRLATRTRQRRRGPRMPAMIAFPDPSRGERTPMKTRADLLLRDALAALFVSACAGDARAQGAIDALDTWAKDDVVSPERGGELAALRVENGRPVFAPDGQLAPEFALLSSYARDRARRFAAALGWLGAEGGVGDPLRAARAAWDAGLFFEVHELLEPEWLRAEGARKTTLQGLILA